MIKVELNPKLKKMLILIFSIAFASSLFCMTFFAQKIIYKNILSDIIHVSGSFEYYREIILNFSFTFSVAFAIILLFVSKCESFTLKSSTFFALAVFASFLITQPLFMLNRWQTGIGDGSYDFGDMFKACAASINMGEDICPPSSMLIYQVMRNTFPGIKDAGLDDYFTMITSLTAGYYIQLFFIFSIAPLVILSFIAIDGTNAQKAFFAFSIMLARPIMIGFERGNSIMATLAFVMFFCLCYRSKNPFIHELALIALAIAFALKIYTAIFGILLLKDRNFKSSVRCAIYAVFLFVFPALCHRDGFIESFKLYIDALNGYMSNLDFGLEAAQLSLKRIATLFVIAFNIPNLLSIIYPIFMIIMIAIFAILIFLSKKTWHTLLACSLATIVIPSLSWPYTAAFLLIPLISVLNEKQKNYFDYASILCILWIFMFVYYDFFSFTRIIFKLNNWWIPMMIMLILALTDILLTLKTARINKIIHAKGANS